VLGAGLDFERCGFGDPELAQHVTLDARFWGFVECAV
jgi:hypothetical protein